MLVNASRQVLPSDPLNPDETWDPDRDRVFLLGNSPRSGGVFVNGERELPDTEMTAGETYRLRFMNITLAGNGVRVRVVRDGYPARWMPIAKDGADLPNSWRRRAVGAPQCASWRREDLADSRLRVGETADFHFRPDPGEYVVEVRAGGGNLFAYQRIRVPDPEGLPR